ncbi:patatin-like phospholipase family protein [Saccharopolyspora aridisoli]|uniref:Patatin-like phospholipase family protein n=1 Tax=Saccharopolyspora aridisoli TaxID=2530385 RepID=A0A4R4UW17_9PSEU|nr:patatin-like phospholipase family protein [Saccharopolyspora aridisoli]TDC93404.1 patatin-like phospholipase family protein [Saccharopolyspora aridisoli]
MLTRGDAKATPSRTGSGIGLVLGAGGVLGACWSIGALRALETVGGCDPRTCDTIVGTSSGSVISAMLACGTSAQDLDASQRCPDEGVLAEHAFNCANPLLLRSPLSLPGLGSPRLLARCLANPLGAPLLHWCTALAPCGRGSLGALRELMEHIAGSHSARSPLKVVATDYDDGRREVFHPGTDDALTLAEAVVASCSVPGLFPPVTIAGRRYVDGAVGSSTNANLLLDEDVDTAIVVAPMAAKSVDRPLSPLTHAERLLRRRVTDRLTAEVAELHEAGIDTTVLAPTAEDLAAIGVNMLNCSRRLSVMDTALRTTSQQLEEDPPRVRTSRARSM